MIKNLFTFLLSVAYFGVEAQSLVVGNNVVESHWNSLQLNQDSLFNHSGLLRPILLNNQEKKYYASKGFFKSIIKKDSVDVSVGLLAPTVLQQWNASLPYGWNDGSMIPAAGLQSIIRTGFYANWRNFSIQIAPEFVWAQNKSFEGFPREYPDIIWQYRYSIEYNSSDIPEKFGDGFFQKLYLGQSYLKWNVKQWSIGFSSENLWWGPGQKNSLLMSNNAPGFKHLSIKTEEPVKTPIGQIELQIIGGRLESSGYAPPDTNRYFNGARLFTPKKDKWRYLSGITFNLQPKWIKGLYIGFNRVFVQYGDELSGFGGYFPLFAPLDKRDHVREDLINRDQLASFFFKWHFPEVQTEVYAEYGRNDYSFNLRDYLSQPDHSAAYLIGLRKILPTKKQHEVIEVLAEITQMQQGANQMTRDAGTWYTHTGIRQGYTHNGQVLGAGIGPGSNHQIIEANWRNLQNLRKLGISLERIARNNDFFYYTFDNTNEYFRRWIDVAAFVNFTFKLQKHLMINGRAGFIRSNNYQWQHYLIPNYPGNFWNNGIDKINSQIQVNLQYLF